MTSGIGGRDQVLAAVFGAWVRFTRMLAVVLGVASVLLLTACGGGGDDGGGGGGSGSISVGVLVTGQPQRDVIVG